MHQIIDSFIKHLFSFDENQPLLFTQFYFWAFFAIVFAIISLLKNKILLRNTFLFAASLFFYYKTSGLFLLILIFTTLSNFIIGKQIHVCQKERNRKLFLVAGIVVNLAFLCYFKYAYLIIDMINELTGSKLAVFDIFAWVGNGFSSAGRFSVDDIFLPVGISFYLFQAISYVMDIYRKRIEPVRNFTDFGFYISFFPQLVAGPIVRAKDFIPQLHRPFFLGRRQFGIAIFWIVNGLAKKIILSDYIAVNFVDRVFENPLLFSGFENLIALFGYSLQVYADFSGYTDIAIGVAMLMGFYLPKNFNSPYKATNPGNFWKRWHISLSSWLQDYLYIPLGGNREATFGTYCCILTIALIGSLLSGSWLVAGIVTTVAVSLAAYYKPDSRKKITTNLNAMNTMLLGGLWHGASWNFMIWGGLNGIGMIVYKFWKNFDVCKRMLIILLTNIVLCGLTLFFRYPVFRLLFVWSGIISVGTFVRLVYNLFGGQKEFRRLEQAWAIFQTFIFITFTRLFFRSGSNLDPAEANEIAWNTAKNMVQQIGNAWNFSIIPNILWEYRFILSIIILGLVIHWLPENTKRRYRIRFAKLPLPIMAITIVVIVFILYQFITSDLQQFIYFQF